MEAWFGAIGSSVFGLVVMGMGVMAIQASRRKDNGEKPKDGADPKNETPGKPQDTEKTTGPKNEPPSLGMGIGMILFGLLMIVVPWIVVWYVQKSDTAAVALAIT